MMADFLFVFGYESPDDWRANQNFGTAAESSSAVWVSAANEEAALSAGRSYAERWVQDLFREKGVEGYPGWCACDYAHWIEREPLKRFSGLALDLLERIQG
jgi:hypothetical protein